MKGAAKVTATVVITLLLSVLVFAYCIITSMHLDAAGIDKSVRTKRTKPQHQQKLKKGAPPTVRPRLIFLMNTNRTSSNVGNKTRYAWQKHKGVGRTIIPHDVKSYKVPRSYRTDYKLEQTERYYDFFFADSMADAVAGDSSVDGIFDRQNTTNTTSKVETNCTLISEWQTRQLSSCNQVHSLGWDFAKTTSKGEWLGEGTYRDAWRIDLEELSGSGNDTCSSTAVVIKTLKPSQVWAPSVYYSHQREAAALSQMKKDYVLDIYGNCANTLFVEMGSSTSMGDDIEKRKKEVEKKTKKKGNTEERMFESSTQLLQIATDVARAVSDSQIFAEGKDGKRYATIAHFDVKPDQFIRSARPQDKKIVKYLLGDFNWSRFLTYDVTNPANGPQICPIADPKPHSGAFRAPEDFVDPPKPLPIPSATQASEPWALSDRTDIYVLGNILYYLATGRLPFDMSRKAKKEMFKEKKLKRKDLILSGRKQQLPRFLIDRKANGTSHSAGQTLGSAIGRCWAHKAMKRPTSEDLATLLEDELRAIKKGMRRTAKAKEEKVERKKGRKE